MKLSFSVPSKSSASSTRPNPAKLPKSFGEESGKGSETKPQFITEFDPSTETLDRTSERVIAPLENTNQWRAGMRMKNLVPPTDVTGPSEPTQFVVDQLGVEPSGTNATYGLTLRSKGAGEEENVEFVRPTEQQEEPMSEGQKFKVDIESLPEHGGMEEFNEVTVEDFSRALLRGYGWKEGQGIGRNKKEDVPIMDPKKWDGTSGLGFHSDVHNSKKKSNGRDNDKDKKKERTPQEENSRIKEPNANGVDKREVVRVISGKHGGSKGEILKKTCRDGMEIIILSLLGSGEAITVGSEMVAELGSPEEERYLRKLRKHDCHSEGEKGQEKRNKKRSRDDEERSIRVDIKPSSRGSHDVRESKTVYWLTSQIRVKVVSKDYKKGRFYLKKGIVTDVISPMLCDVSMDENSVLLQGVDQEVLETVVPHCGGPVLVLYGKHKGVFGKLVEKDKEKETAIIRDADSHELIKVHMDQIAEYAGDPSDIGY